MFYIFVFQKNNILMIRLVHSKPLYMLTWIFKLCCLDKMQ